MDASSDSSAVFSPSRANRYALCRWWDRRKGYALFIGLNPSTADETLDDPTIRRCKRFAADWGFGGLCMANLFALRATEPKVMRAHRRPVGPENDRWLKKLAKGAEIVIAAWGGHGSHRNRDVEVLSMIPDMHCLGFTKDGKPKHPLYLRADSTPMPFGMDHGKDR